MSSLLPLAAVITVSIAVSVLIWRTLVRDARLPLPPGPKGIPIIDNLYDLPKEKEYLVYSTWQETYGDLIYLRIMGQSLLIVNSLEIAADLLERRSAHYSGRIHLNIQYLAGWERSTVIQEGAVHREYRKLVHKGLSNTAVKRYQSLQEHEAAKLLQSLLENPDKFMGYFNKNTASTILSIAYGYEVKGMDDPVVQNALRVLRNFVENFQPGKWLVNSIGFLKYIPEWFPGASFQRLSREWRADMTNLIEIPYSLIKQRMSTGQATPCLMTQILDCGDDQLNEEYLKNSLATLFGAAMDTTSAALGNFILAMILYPKAQQAAQEELDKVVGSERLPSFADRESLPYMEALVKELLRWATVAPMGVPHRVTKEDEYNGYRIPKDTIILPNIWHMTRDNAIYGEDVDVFRPERFLGADAAPRDFSTSSTKEFGSPVFGFGRRACSGSHVAFSTLFIVCSSILSTMAISPAVGADGTEILPAVDCTPGAIVYPKPFKCRIIPRSEKATLLIKAGI